MPADTETPEPLLNEMLNRIILGKRKITIEKKGERTSECARAHTVNNSSSVYVFIIFAKNSLS